MKACQGLTSNLLEATVFVIRQAIIKLSISAVGSLKLSSFWIKILFTLNLGELSLGLLSVYHYNCVQHKSEEKLLHSIFICSSYNLTPPPPLPPLHHPALYIVKLWSFFHSTKLILFIFRNNNVHLNHHRFLLWKPSRGLCELASHCMMGKTANYHRRNKSKLNLTVLNYYETEVTSRI